MSLIDMALEVRSHELAAADRDENASKCDRCHQAGVVWLQGDWLCLEHARAWARELRLETGR